MKKNHKYSILGLKALKRAARKASEEAKKNNCKIPIWKNGQIKFEIPDIKNDPTDSPALDK